MRRFSQRSHLVTLNEINITPLLDLAFVLLIIFIITTPLMDQGLLRLPEGGKPDPQLSRQDIRTLEVLGNAGYRYEGRELDQVQLGQMLAYERQKNPSVVIFIRADRSAPWQDVFDVADLCATLDLGVSFRAEPPNTR